SRHQGTEEIKQLDAFTMFLIHVVLSCCSCSYVHLKYTRTVSTCQGTQCKPIRVSVYKILVAGSQGDSWVIFRRYTDFCRLSDKLQELFPSFHPALPPKRRKAGLQTFLENLVLHKEVLRRCVSARRFLCLVEAPSPFDSLEESRSLEETHLRLQSELADKQREADRLKKTLEERENCLNLLAETIIRCSLIQPLPCICLFDSFQGVTKSTTSKYQAHRSPIMCIYSILCCLMRGKKIPIYFFISK
uniref:PX domain-containing protein n=1 Tax=Astatotilapia calliptera TaxID=8154 RepID=A0A3P8PCY0_ASTCA